MVVLKNHTSQAVDRHYAKNKFQLLVTEVWILLVSANFVSCLQIEHSMLFYPYREKYMFHTVQCLIKFLFFIIEEAD